MTEKIAKDTFDRFRIKTIPDPSGFDLLNPNYWVKKNRICSISMWDEGRNPYFFIELEKFLKGYEIFLLGNRRNNEYYNNFKKSLPENSNIKIITNVSESDKQRLMGESKFLVRFGTLEFGPAIAVMESISNNVPVIINSELGTADMIKNYAAGYVLEFADPKMVADIITNTTEENYQELLKNVTKLRESWTWSEHVKKLL